MEEKVEPTNETTPDQTRFLGHECRCSDEGRYGAVSKRKHEATFREVFEDATAHAC